MADSTSRSVLCRLAGFAVGLTLLLAAPAYAAGDGCRLVAERAPVWRAAHTLERDELRLNYIGHSTFLIETPRGITIETDYNDYVRSGLTPVIATMNKAHSTHFSYAPDAGITHVLRGWGDQPDKPAAHDLMVGDVHVRNVATNIRTFRGTEPYGNSIFIFEAAGLCVGHLGHIHHTLEPEQLGAIGRIDVLLVPVDGSWTLDLPGIVEVVKSLSPTLVIPMHFFNKWTLDRFVAQMRGDFDVEERETPELIVSRASLPERPKLVILPGH